MGMLNTHDLIRGLVLGGFDLTPIERADRLQKAMVKTLFRRKTSTSIKAINRSEFAIDFTVTTDTVDRDDERVMPKSFEKHIKLYDENSIIMYGHRHDMPAVGTTISRTFSPEEFWITVKFAVEEYDFAALLWRLYSADTPFMSAVSAGFIPIKWSSDRAMKLDGQRGRTFIENELIEVSLVNVPSNREALQRAHTQFQTDKSLPATAKGYLEKLIEEPGYMPELDPDEMVEAVGRAVLEKMGLRPPADLETKQIERATAYKSNQLETLDTLLDKTETDTSESPPSKEKGHGSPLVYMFTIKDTVERDQRDIRKGFGDLKGELGMNMWDDFTLIGTNVKSKPMLCYGFDDWNEEIWKIQWKRGENDEIVFSNQVLIELGETEEIPTIDDKQVAPSVDSTSLSQPPPAGKGDPTTLPVEGNAAVPPSPVTVIRQPITEADIKEFFFPLDAGDLVAPTVTHFIEYMRN